MLLSHNPQAFLGRITGFQAFQLPTEVAPKEAKLGAIERDPAGESIVSSQLVRSDISYPDSPGGAQLPQFRQNLFYSGVVKILLDELQRFFHPGVG